MKGIDLDQIVAWLLGENLVYVLLAGFLLLTLFWGVKIVPQSEKYVVERFGRLRTVLGPGINIIVPFLDRVRHRVSVLERQLPNAIQDAITSDNVLVKVETSVFYRVTEPEKTVYRIGSITKQFTAAAIMQMVDNGSVNLDDTLGDHIEEYGGPGRAGARCDAG